MFKKTLSYSCIEAFSKDPEIFIERKLKGIPKPDNLYQYVGNVVHKAASGNRVDVKDLDRSEIERLSPGSHDDASRMIQNCLESARQMDQFNIGPKVQKEKQLTWLDPRTGWQLKAKPDELSMVPFGDSELMEIADLKTAKKFKFRHREQLFFFGLVASLAFNYRGPIRLVVKLLGSNSQKEFWYSPKATQKSLLRVRSTISEIESYLLTNGYMEQDELGVVA